MTLKSTIEIGSERVKMNNNTHRSINTFLALWAVGMSITVILTSHSMEDCESRLFEKLTNMKTPKELKQWGLKN